MPRLKNSWFLFSCIWGGCISLSYSTRSNSSFNFSLADLIPLRCRFMCPLSVAGTESGMYFLTSLHVRPGHVVNWLLAMALSNVFLGGQNKHWWMYWIRDPLKVMVYALLAVSIWGFSGAKLFSGSNGSTHKPVVGSCFPSILLYLCSLLCIHLHHSLLYNLHHIVSWLIVVTYMPIPVLCVPRLLLVVARVDSNHMCVLIWFVPHLVDWLLVVLLWAGCLWLEFMGGQNDLSFLHLHLILPDLWLFWWLAWFKVSLAFLADGVVAML